MKKLLLFIIVISLSHKFLYYDHQFYPIACGITDQYTHKTISPAGTFKIISKDEDPIFTDINGKKLAGPYLTDKNNPYGTRILTLDFLRHGRHYSIHGTNEPELMGQEVSHLCIRLRNEDIEKIFDKVKIGEKVIIH